MIALAACLPFASSPSFAQDAPKSAPPPSPTGPRLSGSAGAAGIGLYQNDRWGLVQAQIKNETDADRDVRLYVRFDSQPAHQFARSVRIPAMATRQVQLAARLSGVADDARSTQNETILLDADREVELGREIGLVRTAADPNLFLVISEANPADDQAAKAMETVRLTASLPKTMAYTAADRLMQFDVGWDGVKAAIITDDNVPLDGAQSRGLRRWLTAGGTVVVFADQVESDAIARVLGGDWPVAYVDRITLTTLDFKLPDGSTASKITTEDPIAMRRILAPGCRTLLSVDGWPAVVTCPVGRGRIIVITVGGRAWYDPDTGEPENADANLAPSNAPPPQSSPTDGIRRALVDELLPTSMMMGGQEARPSDAVSGDAGLAFVSNQIGRSIIGRGSVGLVLGVFVAVVAGAGLMLGRRSSGEWLGVVGVVAAIGAAGVLLGMGYAQRGDIEPTAATLRLVHLQPGRDSAAVDSVTALYDASGSRMTVTGAHGGWGWPMADATAGRLFRMTWLDLDRWTWPDLDVPADAPRPILARQTMPLGSPLAIEFRYTDRGLAGTLPKLTGDAPLQDALLVTRGANLRVDTSGNTALIPADGALSPGVYFGGSVMGEAQQDRKQVLDAMLAEARFDGPTILAWSADSSSLIDIQPDIDRKTQTLWEVPLHVAASEPGSKVRVPWPMIAMQPQRISDERYGLTVLPIYRPDKQTWIESVSGPSAFIADFHLPPQVLPLTIEQAAVHLDLRAINRPVRILAIQDGVAHEVGSVHGPDGPSRIEIDPTKLAVDEHGRVKLAFDVGVAPGQQISQSQLWSVRYFGLEVAGSVAGESPAKPPNDAN